MFLPAQCEGPLPANGARGRIHRGGRRRTGTASSHRASASSSRSSGTGPARKIPPQKRATLRRKPAARTTGAARLPAPRVTARHARAQARSGGGPGSVLDPALVLERTVQTHVRSAHIADHVGTGFLVNSTHGTVKRRRMQPGPHTRHGPSGGRHALRGARGSGMREALAAGAGASGAGGARGTEHAMLTFGL